jgi:hypothetical protein
MSREQGLPQADDPTEQHFYLVIHHMANMLWMKGRAIDALKALTNILDDPKKEPVSDPTG